MNVIILDLELTRFSRDDMNTQHIMQVGAVKLRIAGGELRKVSEFNRYVRPPVRVAKKEREFIGVSKGEIDRAAGLAVVMKHFESWVGQQEYYFCTWSASDLHFFLQNYAYAQNFNITILQNFNDIQAMVMALLESRNQLSLKNAAERIGLHFEEDKLHNAFDDAMLTAAILEAVHENIQLERNTYADLASAHFSVPIYLVCKNCGILKFYRDFPRKRSTSERRRNICIECDQAKRKQKLVLDLLRCINHIADRNV